MSTLAVDLLNGISYGMVLFILASGLSIIMGLMVSGAPGDIAALKSDLGASSWGGYDIAIDFPSGSSGGDMFFDWNFSHRNVTLTTLQAVLPSGVIIKVR